MDPKQTEGQNSGPGNAPAGGFSFSSEPANNTANNSGTLSTGANVARAMSDLNSNRKSATQNSPFAKHQFQKVAPRTGDILIDPSGNIITEEPKQGINRGRLIQFGLIFGGIALAALAIFTVVMVINNKPKDAPKATSVALSYQEAFNRYANWMISGEDSTEEPAIPSNSSVYAVSKTIRSGDDVSDFIATAKSYFDDFRSAFYESEMADNQTLASTVASNDANLAFYLGYLRGANLSDSELLEMYLEDSEGMKPRIEEIYNNLAEQSVAASTFAEKGLELAPLLVNKFNMLNQNGCIKNSSVNEPCQNQLVSRNAEFATLNTQISILRTDMEVATEIAVGKIIMYVSTISNELAAPVEDVEYNEDVDESELKKEAGITSNDDTTEEQK